jgi:predicted phage terminase large subunit-like protein
MWTPIIIVAQRLATDDLPGYVMENYPEDYALVKCSALVNGESIIPETVDTKSLLQTQAANPYAFACQYQQEPVVLGGNLIKLADFRYYDPGSPPKWEIKIMTCDTALKAKEHNDHSVIQCWGRSMKRAFLIDQIRGRWGPAELLNNARMFYAKHHRSASPMHYIAVEEAGAGVNLIAEMKKKGIPAKGIVRLTDKVSRVKAILAFQQVGMVYLPRGALWLPGFEVELASFREDGKSTKDDMVDCFADGVHLTLGKATSILSVLGRKRAA